MTETDAFLESRRPLLPVGQRWTAAGRLHRMSDGFPLLLDLLVSAGQVDNDSLDSKEADDPEDSMTLDLVGVDETIAGLAAWLSDADLDVLVTAALSGRECDIGVLAKVCSTSIPRFSMHRITVGESV